jgi:hypothetical protein
MDASGDACAAVDLVLHIPLLVICSFVIVAAVTIPGNYRPAPNAIEKRFSELFY